jgi:hypothetical protein
MPKMPPMGGLYNIQVEPDCPYACHRTARRLPPLARFGHECGGMADRLKRAVGSYLRKNGFPEFNEILEPVFGQFAIGEYPSDRTMCFFVEDLGAFTPAFVRCLQEQVLAEYPLWRLLAQFEEKNIGIYPQGCWLGNQWVDGHFEKTHPAYAAWLKDADACREKKFGPLRRQIAHVRRSIRAAMAQARRSGFSVLGVFDRYQPPFPGHAIWLLHAGTIGEDALFIGPDQPVRCSPVGDDGHIYSQFRSECGHYKDVDPPFWLLTCLIEAAGADEFAVTNAEGTVVGTVSLKDLIRDDTLIELERRGG